MTEQEARALAFIERHIHDHGYPPSVQEVAYELSVVKSRAHQVLRKLLEQKLITVAPGVARSMVPTGTVMKAPEETL